MAIENIYKFPALTEEELRYVKRQEAEFFEFFGEGLKCKLPLWRRVGMALQSLAVEKLGGFRFGYKNKSEAIEHHLKACKYDPSKAEPSIFRKAAGLEKCKCVEWSCDYCSYVAAVNSKE